MSEAQELPGHELEWGYEIPALAAERIKKNVPVIGGLDLGEVLTGHILERILGDDSGVFGTAMLWFSAKIMEPQEAIAHKEIFLNRIRWEIEQPETPRSIKEILTPFGEKLQETPWDKKKNVKASRSIWEETVYSKVAKMVENNEGGLADASEEYGRYVKAATGKGLPL